MLTEFILALLNRVLPHAPLPLPPVLPPIMVPVTQVPVAPIPLAQAQARVVPNPLAGKALSYLIGIDAPIAPLGRVVEVGYDTAKPAGEPCIAYGNFFNEKYDEQNDEERAALGPYLHTSDTAQEYNEGQIDQKGKGWLINLEEQLERRHAQGFKYIEFDNPDAYKIEDVIDAYDLAAQFGFQVIAKNPLLMEGDPVTYVRHPAVCGVIVERGGGSPGDMDVLRKRAGKPGLPVWFVSFKKGSNDGRAWAGNTANTARSFVNMSVTHSPSGEYVDVVDVLLPNSDLVAGQRAQPTLPARRKYVP